LGPAPLNKALNAMEAWCMKYIKWLVAALLLFPLSAFAFYKPIRVLIPEAFGVTCHEHNVCVEDAAQFDTAAALLDVSKRELGTHWGLSVGEPKIVFCSTEKCRKTFGLSQRAGLTLGTLGILIAPRGWERHYVAHELIHYWQAETFGILTGLVGEQWLIEGMAYSLSNDPREKLHEPFESYRQKFTEWYRLNAGVPLKKSVSELL
jgi:hypothetical protein